MSFSSIKIIMKKEHPMEKSSCQTNKIGTKGGYIASFLIGTVVSSLVCWGIWKLSDNKDNRQSSFLKQTDIDIRFPSKIRSLNHLLALSGKQLENVDIGLMNLLCAEGLKGAENLDIDKCMATLDEWAKVIKHETEIRISQFQNHRDYYKNSEPLFRMVMLVLGLKEKLGVHYNLENMETPEYSDSSQIFIHGILGPKREGSCTSLPVICVAIGRRLGYPVKLVRTAAHSFVRWDDTKTEKHINIEPSTEFVNLHDDEYYEKWPFPLTDLQLKSGYYLRSLTAAEELSTFLCYRGNSLEDTGKIAEAQIAFAYSYYFEPGQAKNLMPLAVGVEVEILRLWQNDCKMMGTNKIIYQSFSGFTRDPNEVEWVYPHFPPKEVLTEAAKKKGVTPQDLLYAELFGTTVTTEQQDFIGIIDPFLQYGLSSLPGHQFDRQQKNRGNAGTQKGSKSITDVSTKINKMINPNQKE